MIFQQKLPDIHNNKETSKNVIFGEKTVKFFFVRIFCGHRIFYDVRNFFPNHKLVREYHIFFQIISTKIEENRRVSDPPLKPLFFMGWGDNFGRRRQMFHESYQNS